MKISAILRKCTRLFTFVFSIGIIASCASDEVNTSGSIKGKIINSVNNEPLQGVSVILSPGSYSTVTGSDGSFEFVDLMPQQYSLQAQKAEYQTNYKQITVVAGRAETGDLTLTPKLTSSVVEVSPTELNFGTSLTELTFSIRNNGNSGTIEWNISGIANWLEVTPTTGNTGESMSSTVKVTVNRNLLTNTLSSYLTINLPEGSTPVHITVSPTK